MGTVVNLHASVGVVVFTQCNSTRHTDRRGTLQTVKKYASKENTQNVAYVCEICLGSVSNTLGKEIPLGFSQVFTCEWDGYRVEIQYPRQPWQSLTMTTMALLL